MNHSMPMKPGLLSAMMFLPVLVSCDPTSNTVVRNSVAWPIGRDGEVSHALRQVAKERGYEKLQQPKTRVSGDEVVEHYSKKLESSHSHVVLGLAHDEESDEVEVRIMDYFRFTRSEESREVEKALRARLQTKN